jgi:hypothetical protein
MEKCSDIYLGNDDTAGFLQEECLQSKVATITEEDVTTNCKQFCRLLGLLDAIWSKVRGIDHGLLPTGEQSDSLATALNEAKALWLAMDLSTLQPKWHVTFDGHLLDQFTRYGGLADKSDESIEKGHQSLNALGERFRGISSYEQREACIRRELRRRRSPEIQRTVDKYEAMIKQSTGTKRSIETEGRLEGIKKAKQERRDNYTQPVNAAPFTIAKSLPNHCQLAMVWQ